MPAHDTCVKHTKWRASVAPFAIKKQNDVAGADCQGFSPLNGGTYKASQPFLVILQIELAALLFILNQVIIFCFTS